MGKVLAYFIGKSLENSGKTVDFSHVEKIYILHEK